MKSYKNIIGLVALSLGMAACQKMDKPALGNYPKDTSVPGGPLKFYAAFDGINADSVRATFGNPKNVTYTAGVNGQAYQGSADTYLAYAAANDWKKSTSATIAFWMKSPEPAAGIGAQFLFSQATSTDIWTKADVFLLMEDGGQSNGGKMAAKFYLFDQWLEFVGDHRINGVLDDQWHHLAFVYDETTSKLTTYVDGAALTGLPSNKTDVKKNGNPRGALDLSKATGFVVGGPAHHASGATPDGWMVNYRGQLDQFRLYSSALSATEVAALFNDRK